ncbi:hypothetical protein IE81DRAFT_325518 [Ceraceosorus guamensis]|uniref:Uncharacterized protein n=1 Tax=Ceraceosorus guamensis TaxID=1522189 RepID=A0A316VSD6_9BASI|nr:hypothetical protein IE81DRAFT_325518 [Ceraceosorus guamensis]PWN40516.1 hypothetical protein IE81DRAFT_325518 [Ceraceosorus guamensis]
MKLLPSHCLQIVPAPGSASACNDTLPCFEGANAYYTCDRTNPFSDKLAEVVTYVV